jgi:hypothetical protein
MKMEEFEWKGTFWLPETENRQVSGIIKFSPKQGIEISLVGCLDKERNIKIINSYPLVWGYIHGKGKITLFDVYETHRSISHRMDDKTTSSESGIIASYLFVGEHFKSKESVNCKLIRFELNNLNNWLGIGGFKSKFLKSGGYNIYYKHPKFIKHEIKSVKKSLNFDWSITFPGLGPLSTECKLKQRPIIILKNTDNSKLNYFNSQKDIFKIVSLLVLLINSKLFITKLSIKINTKLGKPDHEKEINVYYKASFWNDNPRIKYPWEMLLPYKDIKRQLSTYLNNWFISYSESEYIFDMFMGTINHENMFLVHTFLSRVQSIESFHRRKSKSKELPEREFENNRALIKRLLSKHKKVKGWVLSKLHYANELRLRKRMENILKKYESILLPYVENTNQFMQKVVNTRNYYTHFDKKLESKIIPEGEMYSFNIRLEVIMLVMILKEIKMKNTLIEQALKRAYPLTKMPKLKLKP